MPLYTPGGTGTGDMVSTNNLSDVANAATSFNNIKQTATTAATGAVQLATVAEAQAGTVTTKAVTPDGLLATNGWVLLSTQTAASSASIAFNSSLITSTYDQYRILLHSVLPATNSVVLYLVISDDNGSTYKTTGSYHTTRQLQYSGASTFSGSNSIVNTGIPIVDGIMDSNVGRPTQAEIAFSAPSAAASRLVTFKSSASGMSGNLGGTFVYEQLTVGMWPAALAGALNNVKIFCSSGNIASGTFQLFGIRKT